MAWPKPPNSTFFTSFQVRFAKPISAVMFWLSDGAPTTQATRLPLRSRDRVDVRVLRRDDREQRVGVVDEQRAHRLRAPVPGAELEHALLREIAAADAVRRERHLAVAQRHGARDVVLARQDAQVDLELVLERVADRDRLVVAAGADVVGGPGERLRQLDAGLREGRRGGERRGEGERQGERARHAGFLRVVRCRGARLAPGRAAMRTAGDGRGSRAIEKPVSRGIGAASEEAAER